MKKVKNLDLETLMKWLKVLVDIVKAEAMDSRLYNLILNILPSDAQVENEIINTPQGLKTQALAKVSYQWDRPALSHVDHHTCQNLKEMQACAHAKVVNQTKK